MLYYMLDAQLFLLPQIINRTHEHLSVMTHMRYYTGGWRKSRLAVQIKCQQWLLRHAVYKRDVSSLWGYRRCMDWGNVGGGTSSRGIF